MPMNSMNRNVVFVTPAIPSFRGNGLAMRAAATLHMLAESGAKVHLLVMDIYNSSVRESKPEPEIEQLCISWRVSRAPEAPAQDGNFPEWLNGLTGPGIVPREWRCYRRSWHSEITATIEQLQPDLILVFRFYLAPFFVNIAQSEIPIWLDVDEVESSSRARLAHMYSGAGKQQEAFESRSDALVYESLESKYFPHFERIFACSRIEANWVRTRCRDADIRLLPNVYPTIRPQPKRKPDGKVCFLYVGSFGYYPNLDGLIYFCNQILPVIQSRSAPKVELTVVGNGLSELPEIRSMPGIKLIGAVPDTTPYYRDCDLVVVPLRAASGTRIKILEAFSHQRAVVSTSIGAEGLEVQDDVQLSIAEGRDNFAEACLNLINDPDKRETLSRAGHEFFLAYHALEKLEQPFCRQVFDQSGDGLLLNRNLCL